MNRIAKLLAVLALLSAPICTLGADIAIAPTGATFKLPGTYAWGTAGPGGINNSFFFTPFYTQENVCVYVYNNNTTNSHTFSGNISVTGDPGATGPSGNASWQTSFNSTTLTAGASIANPAQFSSSASGVAQISVGFTATTQAGSPDTATVVIIQTTGNCFAGIGATSSNPYPSVVFSQLQELSDAFGQSYSYIATSTNPLANQLISALVNAPISTRILYFDRVSITSTAAATVNINLITSLGTACAGGIAPTNIKLGQANGSVITTIIGACTNPAVSQAMFSNVAIGTVPVVIDLKGIIAPASSSTGIDIVNLAGITGVMTVNWLASEK